METLSSLEPQLVDGIEVADGRSLSTARVMGMVVKGGGERGEQEEREGEDAHFLCIKLCDVQ